MSDSPLEVAFRSKNGELHSSGFCERNLNILAHAQAIELPIGSQCGGHGICGGDRVRIPQGLETPDLFSPPSERELEHLGPELIAQGWRLACQCFPQKPAAIQVEILY